MNRLPRHEQILKLVRANGFMPIEELARLLDVTPQTIRRDINTLSEENLLRRFHGGAALGPSVENEEYATRQVKNQSEKPASPNCWPSTCPMTVRCSWASVPPSRPWPAN